MKSSKSDVLEAGRWLAAERRRRGDRCSGRLVAAAATRRARRNGDGIEIKQQQVSAIENASAEKGPQKLPFWWRHVREAFDSGEIDELLAVAQSPFEAPGEKGPERLEAGDYSIHDSEGRIVGRIVMFGRT